jgi:serine/threonine-protein kinase RsbW
VSHAVELRVDVARVPLVRTMAAAIAMREDYDVESIADLKLIVEEVCALLVRRAAPECPLDCRFDIGDENIGFTVRVKATTPAPIDQTQLGWRLLAALVDHVEQTADDGGLCVGVRLGKGPR